LTDADLVNGCIAGRSEAIRSLVERFQSDILGLSLRMLRHQQDAEDVSQEVFLRIFKSLHRWDQTRPLKPWILTIAANRCRTWLSQRARLPEATEHLAELPGRETEPTTDELGDAIRNGLSELRDDYREVFVLFHEQGLPYETIGAVTGRPVGTIKTWLHRARVQLLDYLVNLGLGPEEPLKPTSPTLP
jgi:RNA polymerase sigma factor (sigma-70 family)